MLWDHGVMSVYLFTLLIVSSSLPGGIPNAAAVQLMDAPRAAESKADSENKKGDKEQQLQLQKISQEIKKLQAEIESLTALSPVDRRWSAWLGALGGFTGALFAAIVAIVGWKMKQGFTQTQEAKMRQDKELTRETHLLELFQNLGHENSRVQIAAASVLLQRLNVYRHRGPREVHLDEREERSTIIQVLVAVTKEHTRNTQRVLLKHIADNLVQAIGAVVPVGQEPALGEPSPLKEFDWQGSQLQRAWWKRVDARSVDFYGADLSEAGLAEAFLSGAVFFQAKLEKAVLRKADLRGANLNGADLTGANLKDALYDDTTQWPDGFDPAAAGAVSNEVARPSA